MLYCAIEFLGGSQTFLGVLIALVVLMPYQGDGNPFLSILSKIRKDVERELPAGSGLIEMSEFENDENYKTIKETSIDEKKTHSRECREFLIWMRLRMNRWMLGSRKENYVNKLSEILMLREIHYAPFYMFLCCLAVFVFDEIMRLVPGAVCYPLKAMFWFMLLTTMFWLFIWGKYAYDVWSMNQGVIHGKRDSNVSFDKELFGWGLVLFVTFSVITILGLYHMIAGWIGKIVVVVLTVILFFKGFYAIKKWYVHEGMGYRFMLKHFTWLMACSAACAFITDMLFVNNTMYSYMFEVTDENYNESVCAVCDLFQWTCVSFRIAFRSYMAHKEACM